MKLLLLIFELVIGLVLSEIDLNAKDGSRNDYYTSLIGIQNLAKLEQQVVARMVNYMKKLQARIDLVDVFLDDYGDTIRPLIRRTSGLRDKYGDKKFPIIKQKDDLQLLVENESANPLVVFKLLRRFAKELADIAVNILDEDTQSDTKFREYIDSIPDNHTLPDPDDIKGAADGLLRIQHTYQLPTDDMANGIFIDMNTGCRLTASDMQHIGVRAFDKSEWATAVEWLYYGLQRVREGDKTSSEELLEKDLRLMTNYHNSVFITFHSAYKNLFTNIVNENMTNIPGLYIPPSVVDYLLRISGDIPSDRPSYRALCRGEQLLPPEITKNLRCWYSKKSPQNMISPLKVEGLHENPPIFQIYDLLSDEMVDSLKEWAEPHLKRATVGATAGGLKSDVRTSSTAWIHEKHHTRFAGIPKMVERATGLTVMEQGSSEELQMSFYGSVGGHYDPHKDPIYGSYKFQNAPDIFIRGDRVATLMFYLTDVEVGGGTAFPKLGVVAKPKKGSAVFWYNLRKNGQQELLMLHGGCPVLLGNKWVANKWIRLNAQMHKWKCTLNRFE